MNAKVNTMANDNYTDVTDSFSANASEKPRADGASGSPSGEAVEKRDDFSSEAEPVEEPVQGSETVEVLRQQLNETEDRMLRLAADYDNYRKRVARQQDDAVRSANDRVFSELLEIVDNFERALQHAKEDTNASAILTGTEMIYNQLLALLAKHDIKPIEALGKPFDPQLHEAMMQVDSDQYPEGTVAMEAGKGYQQGNRVIRHSKVGVSRGKK